MIGVARCRSVVLATIVGILAACGMPQVAAAPPHHPHLAQVSPAGSVPQHLAAHCDDAACRTQASCSAGSTNAAMTECAPASARCEPALPVDEAPKRGMTPAPALEPPIA